MFFGISINTAVCTVLEALLEIHRAHLDKNKAFGLNNCIRIQTLEHKASNVPPQLKKLLYNCQPHKFQTLVDTDTQYFYI